MILSDIMTLLKMALKTSLSLDYYIRVSWMLKLNEEIIQLKILKRLYEILELLFLSIQ